MESKKFHIVPEEWVEELKKRIDKSWNSCFDTETHYYSGQYDLLKDISEQFPSEEINKSEISDSELLDWLQKMLTSKDSYCEIFFAGLRDGDNDATCFQIESNPERFPTLNAINIRWAIKNAMLRTLNK